MKTYIWIDQWAEERFAIRKGKMTASNATAIGNCGKWLETYIRKVSADRIANMPSRSFQGNLHTQAWHELEPIARWLYELETWSTVTEVCFVEYDEYTWCSPDGVIYDRDKIVWLIEIKCLDNPWHLDIILDGKCESTYERQIQMQLFVTGADWCDLVAYNPDFNESLIIIRYFPDETKQEAIKKWLDIGKQMIQKTEHNYQKLFTK